MLELSWQDTFACPCCGTAQLDTKAMQALASMQRKVVDRLQISSGYRCPKHNRTLKGARPNSLHTKGLAFDVLTTSANRIGLLVAAKASGFKGVGVYADHIHVDIRPEKANWGHIPLC